LSRIEFKNGLVEHTQFHGNDGTAYICGCHSAHPIMHFLQESKFAKLRSQLVSVLLKNSESQKNKSTSANWIAKLKSNLKRMKNWKDSTSCCMYIIV
jgi:hypothetical protein